jgi:hypothetical protein
MGPWQSFVFEMTKVLLSWPPVFLVIFLVLIAKAGAASELLENIGDRVRKVSISKTGVHFETLPRGRDLLEELPYREKSPERRQDVRWYPELESLPNK